MSEFVLHFDADSGVDLDTLAEKLQQRSAALAEVDSAAAEIDRSRSTVTDVLLALTLAATVLNNTTTALVALKQTIAAVKAVAEELGLRNVRVEVGMTQVPPADLTEKQATQALAPA